MKTCGHVSSRDEKKASGNYFLMRSGLRNNEFCLRDLISLNTSVDVILGPKILYCSKIAFDINFISICL